MEASQRDNSNKKPHSHPQNSSTSIQDPGYFAFLKADEEERHLKSPPFFSDNGLAQDIIQVTEAEPDVCLEVFYALYHTLWPEIEKQSDVSFKDAWTNFIGGSLIKGSLCPPEKLITEKRVREIKSSLSTPEGEKNIFQYLDQVIHSTSHLKQKIVKYPGQILQKEEITAALGLVEQFYLGFRNQVTTLVRTILEKERINTAYGSETDALEHLLEPKAIMMSDIFNQHWAYRISRNKAEKILSLDTHGRNLQSNLNDPASHRVIALPEKPADPLAFFKANGNPPIQPEKEFMIHSLYRHFQIPVPETALLILTNVFEKNSEYFYAVQASEAVLGESPLKACQDPETIFDKEAYILQVIGALLTNPSDGSFKNFKYSPAYETLISIDNDLVFKPELIPENVVNVKSILYLLDKIDLPIPDSIKTSFTTLDPRLTVFAWLQDLLKKNNEYNLLFAKLHFQKTCCIYQNLLPQSEVPSLSFSLQEKVSVDPELHGEAFHPQILVSRNLLTSFTEKLQIIEKTLRNNRSVSTQFLFEEISPALGKYYRKLRFEFSNPEEALEALWGVENNGVDYSEISSLLDPEEFSSLPEIKLDENLIPERFFEEFQENLQSGESALDRFIRRHNERKKKNALNLRAALKELQFLIQQRLTKPRSIRDIVDFCLSLSKIIDDPHLIKEITSLLYNLPHPELKWLLILEKHFLRIDRPFPKDLIPFSVMVNGTFMKQRRYALTESESQFLFDQHGNINRHPSLTGRSRVTFFPEDQPEFYLKQFPEWPGYEFASTLLMRLLGIQHLPYQDLIIIDSKYPVLLSQKVSGSPVLRVWDDPQAFQNLDPVHTGLLIISAMLLNPEDGKEDNFILSPDGKYLIPIDNDHCFLPSFFQKESNFWNFFTINTALQTKAVLFSLDEMGKQIPLEVKQQILSINFDKRLPEWMAELDKLENQFNNLIDQNQRKNFLEQGTVMRIPFYKQSIQNLHWKAHKIQDILDTASNPTPFDLLKAVEPFAAKCYEDAFQKEHHLQTRFKAATDQLYTKTAIDGSRVSILTTRKMMDIVHISEEELQKDAAFQKMGPIDALEFLSQLIQERSQKATMEQEMLCELDGKKQEKKWVSLFGDSPVETSLKAFLANPKEGLALKGSKLIARNKLTELFAQTPDKGMRIRFLSLPESPLLTEKEIRILVEECPNLEYLNVSGCGKLKQMTTTEGEWPLLARLEAKDCVNLEKLVSYSPMKILRIGTDSTIEIFVEKSTPDVFMVSNKKRGFDFSLKSGDFQVESLSRTISNDNFIQRSFFQNEEVEEDLKDMKATIGGYPISSTTDLAVFITILNLQNLKITPQKIQRMISLNFVNLRKFCLDEKTIIGTDFLEYLIQADWPKLKYFSVGIILDDGMQILAKGKWPLLEFMSLKSEKITVSGIEATTARSRWPQLKQLNLFSMNDMIDKAVETLSQGNWIHLDTLSLSNKSLSKKQFINLTLKANWPKLSKISLASGEDNFSKNLLQQSWPHLEELDLSHSEITQNEIELIVKRANWPRLKHLNLSKNDGINDGAVRNLSQGYWPLLEILNLEFTMITKKGMLNLLLKTKWPNLKDLVWNTKSFVTSLLQKNWPILEELDLSHSKITKNEIELIVKRSNWPQLKYLNLSSSHNICDEAIETLSQGDWPLLETLNLSDIKISAVGVEAFVTQSKWPKLKHLNLSSNEINNHALENLSRGNWVHLQTLSLSDITKLACLNLILKANWPDLSKICLASIEDDFSKNIIRQNWSFLKKLDLSHSGITQNEIELIVKRSNWPQLKYLILSSNHKIDDEAIKILSQGDWPLLKTLNLSDIKISTAGVEALGTQSKWQKLKHLNLSTNVGINCLPAKHPS